MSNLTPLIDALDEGHREFAIALGDFPVEDFWKRAHPRLLSVGELAAHVAFGQAVWFFGDDYKAGVEALSFKSPLLVNGVGYYLHNVEAPVHLDVTPAQALEELARIHAEAKVVAAGKSMEDPHPYWKNWGNLVQYQAFHIAYHTGQAYSVRHMLGHETEDN